MKEIERLKEEIRVYAEKISASHDGNPMLADYVHKIARLADRIRELQKHPPS